MTADTAKQQAHPFAAIAQAIPAFGAALQKHDAGDLSAARAGYLDLIDQPALSALCLHQLGLIAAARGEHQRAAELFRRTIRLDPQQPLAYHNLRGALERMGDMTGAMAALVDLGCVFYNQPDYPQAVEIFRQILQRDPLNYAAHINLGTALAWLGGYREAARHLLLGLELYGRLVREVANFARMIEDRLGAWLELRPGHTLLPPGLPNGAIEKVEDALTTLGKLLNECDHSDEAMLCLRKSIEMSPGFALGHWNLSLALLGIGDFAQGWHEYEWRWHWNAFPEPRRLLPLPFWRGEPLAGKRILVWAEQGYGDAFHFSPLVRRLRDQGAEVFFEAPQPMVRLFRQSFPDITIIERPDNPHSLTCDVTLDYVVPLMSLPDRLSLRAEQLPLAKGYLHPSPEDEAIWAGRLAVDGRPKVGIAWTGRPNQADNAKRSIPFDLLQPLFKVDRVHWHSLQVGPTQDAVAQVPNVKDLSPFLHDFADTAAAISQLDLVISVCTSVAHLAAAMGKPVWLIARQPPDWRWSGDGETTPWYPSMRIFRQREIGDWTAVIQQVADEVARLPRPAAITAPTA
jgi:tetratricopeptide (TPR) repeat protein